uniref:B box-type domain-containing protein n=1 Tax=Varanus komodoensis TaxID=61221 RepID=A0A8D2J0J3_VARKO
MHHFPDLNSTENNTVRSPCLYSAIQPCGHSFCQECSSRFWGEELQGKVSCCHCKDFLLNSKPGSEEVLGKMEGTANSVCETHKEGLNFFCVEDQIPLCSVCRKSWDHASHTVVPENQARKMDSRVSENETLRAKGPMHKQGSNSPSLATSITSCHWPLLCSLPSSEPRRLELGQLGKWLCAQGAALGCIAVWRLTTFPHGVFVVSP